jgi:hypothetical protein
MKKLYTFLLFCLAFTSFSQNITQMEYFFDNDPGFGNATPILGFNNQPDVINFSFTIPNTFTNGIHTVGYRTKDALNRWSHTNFSTFYVLENNVLYDIVELEYFWDEDAGFGNNTVVAVSNPTNNLFNYPFDVNVPANLSIGDHKLFIRSKDSNGTFSHTNYVNVEVEPTVGLSEIEKLGIQLYPNPVNDFLTIKLMDNEPFRLLIYDLNGKLVTDKVINFSTQIDLSYLSTGIYNTLIWKEVNKIQNFKLIKN